MMAEPGEDGAHLSRASLRMIESTVNNCMVKQPLTSVGGGILIPNTQRLGTVWVSCTLAKKQLPWYDRALWQSTEAISTLAVANGESEYESADR